MKQKNIILIVLLMTLCLIAVVPIGQAQAATNIVYYDVPGGSLAFDKLSGKITDVHSGKPTDVVIPSTIDGVSVTIIGNSAFQYCKSLNSISLPDSVTTIETNAFYGCTGLTNINLTDNITSIGGSAFTDCKKLSDINIPSNLTIINMGTFKGCTSLTSVSIPSGLTIIKSNAFQSCTSLQSVYIPASVTEIGYEAFKGCSSLYNLDISNGVTKINGSAFQGCTSLSSINIPASTEYIGNDVFKDCTSLTSVSIDDGVTKIGQCAFKGCTSLTSFNIPTTLTFIGCEAFASCTSLTSISIPSNLANMEWDIFENCSALTNAVISSGITYIPSGMFKGCSSLINVSIPDSVTKIRENAFNGCTSLASITLPTSTKEIGKSAFQSCTNLNRIDIPANVTYISSYAFRYCLNLSAAYFYGNAPKGGNEVFYGTKSGFIIYYLPGKTGFGNKPWSEYTTMTFTGSSGPAIPTGLVAIAGDEKVTLTWNANSESDLKGYNIYYKRSNGNWNSEFVASPDHSYIINDLINGTKYTFKIQAINDSGQTSDFSDTVNATPKAGSTAPSTPTGLKAVAGDGQVTLEWDANSESDLKGYYIAYKSKGGSWKTKYIAASMNTYTFNGLTNDTKYYFKVRAINTSKQYSSYSGMVTAIPTTDTTAPETPTGLEATAGDGEVSLSWDANNESDLKGYYIAYKLSGESWKNRYVGTPTNSYTVTGLNNDTKYYFKIKAVNTSNQYSSYSPAITATPTAALSGPATPTGLQAFAEDSQVSLSWTANTETDLSGYFVSYMPSGGSWHHYWVTTNSATITDLTNGTTYMFKVQAVNTSDQTSSYSNTVTATPTASSPHPAKPTGLTVIDVSSTGISLVWNANQESDLKGYYLYYKPTGGTWGSFFDEASSDWSPNASIGNLPSGTTYYFKVQAINKSGQTSEFSDTVTATTYADPVTKYTIIIDGNISVFTVGSSEYRYNNQIFNMNVKVKNIPGLFLPCPYAAKCLGIIDPNVIWDEANQVITLIKEDVVVQVKIGSTIMLVNGAAWTLDNPPFISDGEKWIPMALLTSAFGGTCTCISA